jgi:hypothetical protein
MIVVRSLRSALVLLSIACGTPSAPVASVRPRSIDPPQPTQAATEAQPTPVLDAGAPVEPWRAVDADVRDPADVRAHQNGLGFKLDASVVGRARDSFGIRVRLEITNERNDTVEVACQPLQFAGQRGHTTAGRLTWGGGFGEGGPGLPDWGPRDRVERLAPKAKLVVERMYPSPYHHDSIGRGDAMMLWSYVDQLCFHRVLPDDRAPFADPAIMHTTVELATWTLTVPEAEDARPRLDVAPGMQSH